jgi:protein SCO1/2
VISPTLKYLLLLLFIASANAAELRSGVFNPPRIAPDFSLQSSQGGDLKLTQTRGKLVVLGFGFTHCTEVCPVTLANLARARKQLGDLGEQVQVIYVTVDPENDNPQRLKNYLANFDNSFIGLTGKPDTLAKVQQDYGILAAKATSKNGQAQVHHSSYVYLIDPAGYLRALVPFGKKPEDIAHDIKILLQGTAS